MSEFENENHGDFVEPPASDPNAHCEPDPRNQPLEAEIVNTQTSLAVRQQGGLPTVQDLEQQFALAVRQRELLSDYIKKQLQPGKHFYEIQGNKPSLTKEGAEIILLPHNLAPDYEIVSGPDAPPADDKPYQITVKCTLRRKGDPNSFVGSGIGSAGSEKRDKHGKYNPRQYDKYLCHNATIKMAEKSAMIAATMNSTAASEFFTQDMDDVPPKDTPIPPRGTGKAPGTTRPPSTPTPAPKAPATPKPATPRVATEATRAWMAKQLEPCMQDALQYFIEIGAILPTETIDDVPLRYVPTSKRDLLHLISMITQFSVDGKVPENETNVPHGKIEVPRDPTPTIPSDPDYDLTQYPFNITCPIPRKGMKRKEYLDNPDTIGSLFATRHGTDADSQADRQRLWGFINQWEPKTWVDRQGQTRMPSDEEIEFRKALDVLEDMMAKKGHKL